MLPPLSVLELHSRLVARSLCPSSVLETTLSSLRSLAELNMFVTVSAETAREQAGLSARRYQEGKQRGPLDGSLLAVKDNFCTKDIKTTCGSLMLDNFTAPYNATVVERSLGESPHSPPPPSSHLSPLRSRLCFAGENQPGRVRHG